MIEKMRRPSSIQMITYGKWILAGEHSVLRGSEALVFPLMSARLQLNVNFEASEKSNRLKVQYQGSKGPEYELLFHSVFQKACELLSVSDDFFSDAVLTIESNLPVGTGLGASAALCVAVAKMFGALGFLTEDQIYDFALKMENIFHGESSGVDIAVCLMGSGIVFQRGIKREPLRGDWQPHLYVSYSGQRGMTFDCVEKVKNMMNRDPLRGKQIDLQMQNAVKMAQEAFAHQDVGILSQALQCAQECFLEWDLCPRSMQNEMQSLRSHGALAVKPTGSGGGGYILSLWDHQPSEKTLADLQLLSCF